MLERIGLGAELIFENATAMAAMARSKDSVDRLETAYKRLGKGVGQVSSGMGKVLQGAAPIGLAITGGTALAVKQYADFEHGLYKVATLLPGGVIQAKAMGGAVEGLALKFGRAGEEINEGLYQVLSSNVAPEKALGFLDTIMEAAEGGFAQVDTTVLAATKVLASYGMQADEVRKVTDALIVAQDRGQTTLGQLADGIGMVAGTAASAKVPFNEVTSAIATMTTKLDTPEAITSLNQMLVGFIKPGKEAKELAKRYGIELSLTALKTKGLQRSLAEAAEKIGDNDEVWATLFGNVRAYRGALALTGPGQEHFNETLRQTNEAAGVTAGHYQTMAGSLKTQLARALEVGRMALGKIGKAFLETFGIGDAESKQGVDRLVAGLERVEGGARKFFGLIKQGFDELRIGERVGAISSWLGRLGEAFGADGGANKLLSIGLALSLLAAAAAPVLLALSPVVSVLKGLGSIAMGLTNVWGGLTQLWSLGSGIMGGAFLPILGVAGLLLYAVATNAGGLRDTLGMLFGVVMEVVGVLGSLVGSVLEAVMPAVRALAKILGGLISVVLRPVIGIVHVLAGALEELAPLFEVILFPVKLLGMALEWLVDVVGGALSWVLKLFGVVGKAPQVAREAKAGVEGQQGKYGAPGDEAARAAELALAKEPGKLMQLQSKLIGEANSKQAITVNSNLMVDGHSMAVATARAQLEVTERAGQNVTPWQRRAILERGVRVG